MVEGIVKVLMVSTLGVMSDIGSGRWSELRGK